MPAARVGTFYLIAMVTFTWLSTPPIFTTTVVLQARHAGGRAVVRDCVEGLFPAYPGSEGDGSLLVGWFAHNDRSLPGCLLRITGLFVLDRSLLTGLGLAPRSFSDLILAPVAIRRVVFEDLQDD